LVQQLLRLVVAVVVLAKLTAQGLTMILLLVMDALAALVAAELIMKLERLTELAVLVRKAATVVMEA
jgi:hypothetical protein